MNDGGVRLSVEVLVGTELSVADHAELADAARAAGRLRAFVDLADVQINRRTRQLAAEGDRSSDHVLIDEGRLSGKDAKSTDERDRVCETLPQFEDALANGDCTADHLDSLARHTKDLTDEERADVRDVVDDLLSHAADEPAALFDRNARSIVDRIRNMHRGNSDVDEFERQRKRSNVKRWTDRDTGMKHTHLALDPLRDAAIWNVIDHHLATLRQDPSNQERPFAELQVEAVVAAVSAVGPDDTSSSARVPRVVVHADASSLCHGRHDDTLCETVDGAPLPVATVQRLCCEAVLQAVIVRPDGTVDQICAEQRTASRQQRRMLAAMYRTCAHPHCEVGFSRCRIHHVEWFTRGGRTVMANLLPLCETHHHLVHEGGWNLTIDPDRRVTWVKPDGTVWQTDHGPPRTGRSNMTTRPRHRPPADTLFEQAS
ncbi:MAG: HNH endonuclease [Ilumatobacteraceae bacterium]|nr:HNH endonuclease [Ilumatobacteraceae bacterium]